VTAPYFDDGKGIRLYLGDARKITEWLDADALLVDPPYGVDYKTNRPRANEAKLRRSIKGDQDTAVRDELLAMWGTNKPAIVFGSWTKPRPAGTHTLLIWDTLGALGMGNTSVPWKPSHQEMYVIGYGWQGHRGSDVYSIPPVQSAAKNGRLHPHEKPVPLLRALLEKARRGWTIADPTCGSGSLLVAARLAGLAAIGVEREESDCELVARRLTLGDEAVKRGYGDDVLDLDGAA
jgi:hypothetical protein